MNAIHAYTCSYFHIYVYVKATTCLGVVISCIFRKNIMDTGLKGSCQGFTVCNINILILKLVKDLGKTWTMHTMEIHS